MAGKYAINTETSVDSSKTQISKVLKRYGATTTSINETPQFALVAAQIHGIQIRIRLQLPLLNDPEITMTPTRKYRNEVGIKKEYDRAIKSTLRALYMILHSRLEEIDRGISTAQQAFMPWIMLPDNSIVEDHVLPTIKTAYETGQVPPLLPESMTNPPKLLT